MSASSEEVDASIGEPAPLDAPGAVELGAEVRAAMTHRVASDEAFVELFERERQPMVRLAYLLLGSEPLAEEVVQDAFATVYLRWSKVDRPGAYLRRCVVNGARSAGRRRSLERRRVPVRIEEGAVAPARELLDALAALPLPQRAVVVLRYYEGMTQEEIAGALDLRVGTVKSRLHRGLVELRKVLEP